MKQVLQSTKQAEKEPGVESQGAGTHISTNHRHTALLGSSVLTALFSLCNGQLLIRTHPHKSTGRELGRASQGPPTSRFQLIWVIKNPKSLWLYFSLGREELLGSQQGILFP